MDTSSKLSIERAQEILTAQPFSRLLDAKITAIGMGTAEITIPIRADLLQHHGFVHGGVISYAADNTLTFAGATYYGDGLTAEYKLNYLRPMQGEKLIARAQVVNAGKRQAVCRCDVYVLNNGAEKICATALGSIVSAGT